ncbi:MAG TPA: ATP-dependent helicase C-terminal domain-containing protein [Vicinamibacterales bacterium]|nr:ATP-dependent helicase C-terminal domain-containing protein [Vicinamibacterales bacterium]
MPWPLPIDPFLPEILDAVRSRRAVVVTAAPGAGKTTRVPPVLAEDGPVLLLQPRRVAARAIARRIAVEREWTLGREVGWHVRFERRFSDDTRVLVATEGILTARLQDDPLAAAFRTIVIDEFHERSLFADVGLALARQAWLARDDLRLVVMSATLDANRVAAYLGGCPIVTAPGRSFPLEVSYRPGVSIAAAIADVVARTRGAVLCFLPGAPEIRRATSDLAGRLPSNVPVLPLHGGLDADAQDAALEPGAGTRVILATNLAETTLTVPDVVAVVDTGLHKVARYDAERGIDSLETERISQDSADQRAGRAGRTAAGVVVRLWDARDRLRAHREAEIARVDLAAAVLDVMAWGGDARTLDWFEAPTAHAIDAAHDLLARLGAIDAGRLTALGARLQRLPIHPRLGRLLLEAGAGGMAARACAILSERHFAPARHGTTDCDLLAAAERGDLPPHVLRVAADLGRQAAEAGAPHTDERFRRAVLAAYPDRVARRREANGDRLLLASGAGARLGRDSGVTTHEFLVAVDVAGATRPGDEALVRMATGIEKSWLRPNRSEIRHRIDDDGRVGAERVTAYDAIELNVESVAPDPLEASRLIEAAVLANPDEAALRLIRRLTFARQPVDLPALVHRAAQGARSVDEVRLEHVLDASTRRALDRDAPVALTLPSGRECRLDYRDTGHVVASAKLQELFGLAASPRLGPGRVPVTFELLSPAGRPVQVTSDLESFWRTGYPEVKKELRARYPRHPWPDDPWSARPTARPIPRNTPKPRA